MRHPNWNYVFSTRVRRYWPSSLSFGERVTRRRALTQPDSPGFVMCFVPPATSIRRCPWLFCIQPCSEASVNPRWNERFSMLDHSARSLVDALHFFCAQCIKLCSVMLLRSMATYELPLRLSETLALSMHSTPPYIARHALPPLAN